MNCLAYMLISEKQKFHYIDDSSIVTSQIILIVGAKLQVIITKMGRRTHDMADVIKGTPTVRPGDDLFWFGRPKLVLYLINFVLFQVHKSSIL